MTSSVKKECSLLLRSYAKYDILLHIAKNHLKQEVQDMKEVVKVTEETPVKKAKNWFLSVAILFL